MTGFCNRYAFGLDDSGSVLLISVLILLLLTIIGIAAINTTDTDIMISGNYKVRTMAFYAADAGINVTPKIISKAIENDATPISFSSINFGSTSKEQQSFYKEIMGFSSYDSDPDLTFKLGNCSTSVDVQRMMTKNLAGGGVEFACGAEGIGVGSNGGIAVFYYLDSFGSAPKSALSNVGAEYRKVVGIKGGL